MAGKPDPENRKEQILAAARERFVTDGYSETPVSRIVADVGVSQGTFYNYYASKQEVVTDLRRQVFRDYATAFANVASSDAPADARIATTLFEMADAVRRNQDLERVFRAAESAEATERAGIEGRNRLADGVAVLLDEAIAEGRANRIQTTRFTAYFAVTLFERVLYEALEYGVPASLDEVVEEGIRFALGAMGVHPERIEELIRNQGA
jgi:AcrR family transcriptional regulator